MFFKYHLTSLTETLECTPVLVPEQCPHHGIMFFENFALSLHANYLMLRSVGLETCSLNLFQANVPFLYPLQRQKN